MLGRLEFWDKSGGVGVVSDVEGKNWHITDDMIDDDEVKAKMKDGFILNFEPNPSMDNSGMRLKMASPDDRARFDKERSAKKEPLADGIEESAKSDLAKAEKVRDKIQAALKKEREREEPDRKKIKELVKKLADAKKDVVVKHKKFKSEDIEMMQHALLEADEDLVDQAKTIAEAPHELQVYVELVLDEAGSPLSIESVKEVCDDTDLLSDAADAFVDPYTKDLLSWYSTDIFRLAYADEAIREHIVGGKGTMEDIMRMGQYLYHSEYIQNAADWLKTYLEDQESQTTEEGAEIGGLITRQ